MGIRRPQLQPGHQQTSALHHSFIASGSDFKAWAFSIARAPAWSTRLRTKCRHIDDILEGNLNDITQVQCTLVPATLQSLAAITRAMASRFPMGTLQGLPSEFASAYLRAAADSGQTHLCAVATWSYSNHCVVFGLAVTQLFDGKSASLSAVGPWHISTVAATTIASKACSQSKSHLQRSLIVVHGRNLHGSAVGRIPSADSATLLNVNWIGGRAQANFR